MGGRLTRDAAPSRPSKIEARMVQAMAQRAQSGKFGLKSFNSIIMKFPKIDKSFQDVRAVFKKFDANGNGSIDLDELQLCFKELQVTFGAEEIQAFYAECDMDSSHGIEFKEFIVVLALVYLLEAPPTSSEASSQGEAHVSFQYKRAQGEQGMIVRRSILLDVLVYTPEKNPSKEEVMYIVSGTVNRNILVAFDLIKELKNNNNITNISSSDFDSLIVKPLEKFLVVKKQQERVNPFDAIVPRNPDGVLRHGTPLKHYKLASKGGSKEQVIIINAEMNYQSVISCAIIQKSRIGLPQLETTFDTIVEAFVFFDRDKDGYVSKDELVGAINEISPGKQGAKIGMQRFEEMDWDKDGKITFKEFLFAFTDWVGLEDEAEEE